MKRNARYQGAIVHNNNILLIRHLEHRTGRTYWILPGGGREGDESEEDCVRREMKEETGLVVRVERLLLSDSPKSSYGIYQLYKTYLCFSQTQDASPGYEPEPEASASYAIAEVKWFDLRDEKTWGELVLNDKITYPILKRIQETLGYSKSNLVSYGLEITLSGYNKSCQPHT
jgi:ADP-ribose pyrophosphatase YjhB (NUDIX family)